MAIMIPERPHNFDPASQEGLMFDALQRLPDDYYVFHSFRISTVKDDTFYESETDFVVFNRKKGVLCIEAKAGRVKYDNGYWYYQNGMPMHNGGPFNQASANKWKLKKYFEANGFGYILGKCKFLHGVWFPAISDSYLSSMTLPSEADKKLVLTTEALTNPLPYIEQIFNLSLPYINETNISNNDADKVIREIFCPHFDVFLSSSMEGDFKKIVFRRMLNEQAGILNFLCEQKTAVINGAAGTGKTMIAVEKAIRHAAKKESVLFLCYNNQLKSYLAEHYANTYIQYYTISGLACKLCNTDEPDYKKLVKKLEDLYIAETFPYKHVIVDEGQDFGIDDIEEANILQAIKDIIVDSASIEGTFYVFYDRLQLVHGKQLPKFIEEADCKLTLYRNCRNTENIATTSLKPISQREPELLKGCVKGAPAKIHFCESTDKIIMQLDESLQALKTDGFQDIVILSCKTEDNSVISDYVSNGKYKKTVNFTTCRKFKGLEADAVILIDVDGETFNTHNVLLYYVGTSRARIRLEVICTLSDEECIALLQTRLGFKGKIRKAKRSLATALNAIGTIK